jgi:hydrogenase maturation protein HypF
MTLEKTGEEHVKQGSQTAILQKVVAALEAGEIVAIKGIGGYLITCDATNKEVIMRLRKLKNRPSKPFAVMYHDFYLMAEDVDIDASAMLELKSASSPIVLLPKKNDPWSKIAFDEIAPGLKKVGVMLPYTPLYVLLLKEFGKPVIATSGNMSGDPIEFIESNARDHLSSIVDLFVHNNRAIKVPQDDSVISISPLKKRRVVIRRSRGLAPTLIAAPKEVYKQCVLTMGGLLKSSIGLSAHGNLYISQYLGDTDAYQTQKNYSEVLNHFLDVLDVQPSVVICDKHPYYYSSQEGERLSGELNLPLIKVQHHIAHFYAILGEHHLFKNPDPVLGVIWDGTGLGDDDHIWGGEMFLYDQESAQRIHHLPYFDYIAGDKMAREPRISALTIVHSFGIDLSFLKEKFTDQEWLIYQSVLQSESKIRCSSMGRLFDAVASIVLGKDRQSYEGEAAMLLENAAHRYFEQHLPQMNMSYLNEEKGTEGLIQLIVNRVIKDVSNGVDRSFIAARFHVSLVDYIDRVATSNSVRHLAFSGGVFQNVWLIDLIHLFLSKKYTLYFHHELSPNDESISFGQLMYYFETQNK